MEVISIREFLRNPKKYLKPGKYLLTRYKEPYLIIEMYRGNKEPKEER